MTAALDRLATHAGTDATRPHLRAIYVETGRAYATDGHRLLVIRDPGGLPVGVYTPDGTRIDPKTAPKPPPIDNVIPTDAAAPNEIYLPPLDIRAIRNAAALFRAGAILSLIFSDLGPVEIRAAARPKIVRGKDKTPPTPEFRAVIRPSTYDARTPIAVNVQYLLDAIDALALKDATLRFAGDRDPIRIDSPTATAVVMPMRV